MAKPSDQYWAERAFRREQEAFLEGAELSDTLFRQYEQAARAIRRQVNDFYVRYANKHGLTYEQAVKLLNRPEMQEWRADLGSYVEAINRVTDPQVKRLLTAQLDALSANSRITRLEALQGQVNAILNDLYAKGVEQMRAEFGDLFEEGYYKAHYDMQMRAGYYNEIAKITPSMIENAVSYPWSGASFSQRLWQNIQALEFNARSILTQGLIQGTSPVTMSKALAAKMGQSYKVAERLIRTETNHFHNEADKSAYEAAGVEQYEYMSGLDERTCEICGALDGEVFDLDKAQAGTNYPPMHPNCRCTTVMYDPEDALDWFNSGEPMPKNTKYSEWKARQGVGADSKEHVA